MCLFRGTTTATAAAIVCAIAVITGTQHAWQWPVHFEAGLVAASLPARRRVVAQLAVAGDAVLEGDVREVAPPQ
jgi:hypothetical protein